MRYIPVNDRFQRITVVPPSCLIDGCGTLCYAAIHSTRYLAEVVVLSTLSVPSESAPKAVYTPPPSPRNRLGSRWRNALVALAGAPWQRRLARAALYVPRIRFWEKKYDDLSDADMKSASLRLRGRARGGESLDKLLPEAFGLVCVASQRHLGLRPFDVQLAAGVVLHHGGLAELATGEGKTLIASLPAFLNALDGKGVHVTTVNDYLAHRDAEWMGPVYKALGLTVGVLQLQMPDQDRIAAYRCDITYGTASEFGFDFLRDRLKVAGAKGQDAPFWAAWLRTAHAALARSTPTVQRPPSLRPGGRGRQHLHRRGPHAAHHRPPTRPATPEEQVVYHWADQLAQQMEPRRALHLRRRRSRRSS